MLTSTLNLLDAAPLEPRMLLARPLDSMLWDRQGRCATSLILDYTWEVYKPNTCAAGNTMSCLFSTVIALRRSASTPATWRRHMDDFLFALVGGKPMWYPDDTKCLRPCASLLHSSCITCMPTIMRVGAEVDATFLPRQSPQPNCFLPRQLHIGG